MYIHVPVHVEVEHMLVGYTATVHRGVGGGRGVSVSGDSELRRLCVFVPLSSFESSS